MGYASSSQDNIVSSRMNQSNFTSRHCANRSLNHGQLTVLAQLQVFNERLTLVEQRMNTMTNLLQRIDDRIKVE